MHKLAIEALRHKYQADMADAEFVFQVYFDRPAGVGEHPGLLQEMDTALEKWGEAQDKLAALATLTMEIDDAEEEEPAVVISVD
jgi:hypothetical protein|tara:strand:- start:538 stop:789 length:252 start_codon:yes stop_codon:yes gene_type:complete